MKVSLLKMSRNKEVINRLELQQLADMIRKGSYEQQVYNLRLKILNLLAAKYTYFDASSFSSSKLGKAISSYKFNFKHRVVKGLSEYWLTER